MTRRKSRRTQNAVLCAGAAFCATGCSLDIGPGDQAALRLYGRAAPTVLPLVPAIGAAAIAATPSYEIVSTADLRAPSSVSVVSFNMQHRDRPEELALMAERLEQRPDFILCQEVMFERSGRQVRADTAAVLAGELGYFSRGTKRAGDREGVAIVSRYPFAHFEARHLDARTSALLLGFKRVSVMGEFLVPQLGRVRVVSVHFAYHGFEHHVRRRQLTETLAWIAARARHVPADVTILGGDFNMTPDRKEWSVLVDPALNGDLEFLNANTDEPTRGATGNPSKRVDYIFVAAPESHVLLLRRELLFKNGLWPRRGSERVWISDHLPVFHEYAVYPTKSVRPDKLAATP